MDAYQEEEAKARGVDDSQDDDLRIVEYNFGPMFLDLQAIGMQVGIEIGDKPAKAIRMIEKHFFKGNCIHTYDFKTGFCIPKTVNTWESIYELPVLDDDTKQEMIDSPGEARSDSYFFVGDQLIMHQRCVYNYN